MTKAGGKADVLNALFTSVFKKVFFRYPAPELENRDGEQNEAP